MTCQRRLCKVEEGQFEPSLTRCDRPDIPFPLSTMMTLRTEDSRREMGVSIESAADMMDMLIDDMSVDLAKLPSKALAMRRSSYYVSRVPMLTLWPQRRR
jgi:hypothetical protein